MPHHHGWLYTVGPDGTAYELINHARTAAYLSGIGLPNGMAVCDVIDDGGCSSYPYTPPCTDMVAHVEFPADATDINRLTVPDSPSFSAPAQLDLRFALGGLQTSSGGATTRYLAMHGTTSSSGRAWLVSLFPDNTVSLLISTSGSTPAAATTSDEPLATSDVTILLRVTWRSSDGQVRFFRKPVDFDQIATRLADDDDWIQFSDPEISPITAALFDSPAPLTLGNRGAVDSAFEGQFYGFWLATTIDGPAVVEIGPADITDLSATEFTATSGQTVTVERAVSGPQLELVMPQEWTLMTFSTPAADDAPWYTPNDPESADALGFWIEDWTGLDNAHIRRNVTARGGMGGGGQLGVLTAGERTMGLNLMLFARSEAAMEHLYRWLEQTLSNVCATCATEAILIRRHCGSDPADGLARLNQVGLIAGPQWEAPPTNTGQCFVRRLSLTLAAGDPCMYLPGTDVPADSTVADVGGCLDELYLGATRDPCRPSCLEITTASTCRSAFFYDVPPTAATQVPVVTLSNDAAEYTLPVRLICYADPLEMETAPGVTDPCALQILGELYVRALRPGATLVWDVAARDVTYRDHTTGHHVPGWAFVDPNDRPQRRWFALPCGQVLITCEIATACLEDLGGGAYSDGPHRFDDPHYPTLSVEIVERVGCP